MRKSKPTVLITAATDRIGGSVVRNLAADISIPRFAAVRSAEALAD